MYLYVTMQFKYVLTLIIVSLSLVLFSLGYFQKDQQIPVESFTTQNPGEKKDSFPSVNQNGLTIQTRYLLPSHYQRVETDINSFAAFLQNLPLKTYGTYVKYYNGQIKDISYHDSVIDIDTGTRDLQQCADAVMRLRSEYLFNQEKYDQIKFNFTNGFEAPYSKWRQGYRISVKGNKVSWYSTSSTSDSYESFRKYLNLIFAYAGTLSLEKELLPVSIEDLEIGQVFIQGGSPGHAIIVVDMAQHLETKEKIFLLAQSYMPAQDIHILKNLNDPAISPWYSIKNVHELVTPEWTFGLDDLKKFPE